MHELILHCTDHRTTSGINYLIDPKSCYYSAVMMMAKIHLSICLKKTLYKPSVGCDDSKIIFLDYSKIIFVVCKCMMEKVDFSYFINSYFLHIAVFMVNKKAHETQYIVCFASYRITNVILKAGEGNSHPITLILG